MKIDRYHRARKIFDEAFRLPASERNQYIKQVCATDGDLATVVVRMVNFAEGAPSTLELISDHLHDDGVCDTNDRQLIGTSIRQYRIVELIGRGGFGVVYRAEQSDPVQLVVAVKVIQTGMDSRRVIGRFREERRTLALMEHPNIARVFDAGQTEPGQGFGSRPYVVMEFIDGRPITEYCDQKALSLAARLELLMTVCQGVQHAHQKGIIHRDLKPSNILVTEVDGVAIPKIIDFGIAKAIRGPISDRTLVTSPLELLGTPQYMSPEHAAGDDKAIDTRTDVYSLGVVLYELLTGTTPLDSESLANTPYSQMLNLIIEQKAEWPSTRVARLGETARRQHTDPASLRRQLRGDLDWITLKALDVDRDRRYESAAALAQDVRRYMSHEPVEAGPPSAAYRLRKFVRRHRLGVTATTIAGAAIIGGAIVATVAMVRARDSADQTRQVNEFMRDVLTSVDPERGKGADVRLVEVLRNASDTASRRFAGHPELEAQVRDQLGQVYTKLSLVPQATSEFKQAATIWESSVGPVDPRTLRSRVSYACAVASQGEIRECDDMLRELIGPIERVCGVNHDLWFTAQRVIASHLALRGQRAESEDALRRLWRQAEAANVNEATKVAIMESLLQLLSTLLNEATGAARDPIRAQLEDLARQLSARSAKYFGASALITFIADLTIAETTCERGDFQAAADICLAMLSASRDRLGICHEQRLNAMEVLSWALVRLDNGPQAAEVALERLECLRSAPPIVRVANLFDATPILDRGRRWIEGEQCARELAQSLRELGGGHAEALVNAELSIARFVCLQGRLDEAEQLFRPLLQRETEFEDDPYILARMHMYYGAYLVKRNVFDQAEQHLQVAAKSIGDVRHGTWNTVPDDLIVEFIALYRAWGKPEQVAQYEALRVEALAPRHSTAPRE